MSTSNEKLLKLGVHNTVAEIIEAHLSNQRQRLVATLTGRSILDRLGMTSSVAREYRDLPIELRGKIAVAPIPRNMHPIHHAGRRDARARAIGKANDNRYRTVYTDVADYARRVAMTAVVTNATSHITSINLPCTTTDQAEGAAIALAISQTNADTVITNSQQAYRNYPHGRVSKSAFKILLQRPLY